MVVNTSFSTCGLGPETVSCHMELSTGSASLCTQSVWRCDARVSPLGCWCSRATDTGYIYTIPFVAEAYFEGANMSCDFDCTFPSPGKTPPTVDIQSSCLNIRIGKSPDRRVL